VRAGGGDQATRRGAARRGGLSAALPKASGATRSSAFRAPQGPSASGTRCLCAGGVLPAPPGLCPCPRATKLRPSNPKASYLAPSPPTPTLRWEPVPAEAPCRRLLPPPGTLPLAGRPRPFLCHPLRGALFHPGALIQRRPNFPPLPLGDSVHQVPLPKLPTPVVPVPPLGTLI
jgi:hypothetical protein